LALVGGCQALLCLDCGAGFQQLLVDALQSPQGHFIEPFPLNDIADDAIKVVRCVQLGAKGQRFEGFHRILLWV
jgi:hypothetical protein